jgi:hypothetical protein
MENSATNSVYSRPLLIVYMAYIVYGIIIYIIHALHVCVLHIIYTYYLLHITFPPGWMQHYRSSPSSVSGGALGKALPIALCRGPRVRHCPSGLQTDGERGTGGRRGCLSVRHHKRPAGGTCRIYIGNGSFVTKALVYKLGLMLVFDFTGMDGSPLGTNLGVSLPSLRRTPPLGPQARSSESPPCGPHGVAASSPTRRGAWSGLRRRRCFTARTSR